MGLAIGAGAVPYAAAAGELTALVAADVVAYRRHAGVTDRGADARRGVLLSGVGHDVDIDPGSASVLPGGPQNTCFTCDVCYGTRLASTCQ